MTDLLEAVIFDMDGVITDTMSYHYRAWYEIFRDEGIPITAYEIYQREGQKGIESIREIFAQYGKPFSNKHAQEMLVRKEILFKKISRRRFVIGVRPFIRILARKNIILAIVTGTSRQEVNKVLPEGLLKYFSVIICGTDVINGKPHPEPYLKALKALKKTNKVAVVIENAPLGIRSAKAADLTCFAITTSLPRKYLHEADCIFPDFASLKTFFRARYGV